MSQFTSIRGIAAPFPTNNVDTDVLFPGRFLSTIKRKGLGPLLFHGLRYDEHGVERPEFVLNKPDYREAQILITGENFGCGSSREHAPWALLDFGIKCVIATSFADIFAGNCVKNGILCISLDSPTVARLMEDAQRCDIIGVDLRTRRITRPNGQTIPFTVPAENRDTLLSGIDAIDQTLMNEAAIASFEAQRSAATPWL